MILKNKSFCAEINKDGVLTSFSLNDDKYSANFILSSIDEPWVPENKQWGLGFITAGHEHKQIETCTCLKCDDNKVTAVYEIEYTEPRFSCVWNGDIEKSRKDRKITVTVTRELKDDGLYEYYEFRNDTDKVMALDEIGIYSSFRDVYVAKPNALHTHVNSHICIAGDLCYIEAQRQSGIGTNIALITLEGAFETYQLEEQNSSNIRGVVALVAKDIRIASGGIKTFSRVLTDYNRRENFEQKLSRYTGYPIVDYGRMIVQKDESIQLTVKDIADLKDIKIEGELLTGDTYIPAETGEIHGRIRYGCKTAKLKYKVIDNIKDMLAKRAEFIVKYQQMNDQNDPRYGAFMPYDIEREKIFTTEDAEGLYHSIPDKNEVRERMGMGAFIALYSRLYGDARYIPALKRYGDFMMKYIVDENYDVWDSYLRQGGEKYYHNGLLLVQRELDMRFRTHNYAFALPFFIEMYNLTKEISYAKTALGIMSRYYEVSDIVSFVPHLSDLNPEALAADDIFIAEKISSIKQGSKRLTDELCCKGDNYIADETAYEHGAPSSIFKFLTDYYLAEHDESVMQTIKEELVRTLAFDGNQPHFNANGVPIRHWDAFWFGKYELWGDTMPHWVSCLSACGYSNYYMITGDKSYRDRAEKIFRANIALINKDGSAYNSYIFNEKTNGRPAGRYDPLSNDQDWMYYYYLKYCEKGVFELK